MSSDNFGYTWEKLMVAVHGMASSPRSMQQRIADAYTGSLMRLKADDFPDDLRWTFEEISKKLTSGTPTGDEGTVQASVSSMSEEEASEIAREIVNLYDQISARYRA